MGGAVSGETLLANLVEFGRVLRGAGLPVTVGQLSNVTQALGWIDVGDREQVFLTCRALLVARREDLPLFEILFHRFFGWPDQAASHQPQPAPLAPRHDPARQPRFTIVNFMAFKARQDGPEIDIGDRAGRYTDIEVLRSRRFAEMTPEELEAVKRLIEHLSWDVALRISRRHRRDRTGPSVDFRRVLKEAGRLGTLPPRLPRRARIEKERPVVMLADISGSMEKYSRLVLQLFHSAVHALRRVETFVFATCMSRITQELRLRNIDRALDEATHEVSDWSGGTRIGACLREFNRRWSRRLLRRGSVVVIVSDGCDRGDPQTLRRELRYLQHRCHRLIWLNPHLGHPQYEPRATGMAAALDFVDDFLPVDDVSSLEAFSRALAAVPRSGRRPRPTAFAFGGSGPQARASHSRGGTPGRQHG